MSLSRIKYIKQFYQIASYTFTNNNINIVTVNDHNLYTGIEVNLSSDRNYSSYKGIANVTSANTFSVPSNNNIELLTNYYVKGYYTGQSGTQSAETLPRATGTQLIIQSYVSGNGAANVIIETSLDASHWIPAGYINHTNINDDTGFLSISPGWAYMRANIVSLGANTNLVLIIGE